MTKKIIGCLIGIALFLIPAAPAFGWTPGSPECMTPEGQQRPDCQPPTTTTTTTTPTTSTPTTTTPTTSTSTETTPSAPYVPAAPPKGQKKKHTPTPSSSPTPHANSSTASGQLPFTGLSTGEIVAMIITGLGILTVGGIAAFGSRPSPWASVWMWPVGVREWLSGNGRRR